MDSEGIVEAAVALLDKPDEQFVILQTEYISLMIF
jgi:hypothetical protein